MGEMSDIIYQASYRLKTLEVAKPARRDLNPEPPAPNSGFIGQGFQQKPV